MNKVPKISIVIPSLNMSNLLKDCLDGISRTCDITFEVIVSNNGSTDDTKDYLDNLAEGILKKNPNFVRLIALHLPFNRFISGGINTGMIHATGEYLCICANDILVPPGYFSWAIDNLEKNPKIGTISPFYTEDPRFAGADNFYANYDNVPKSDEWTKNWHLSVIQVFTREMWEKVGEWDERTVNHLMDNDHGQRIFFAGFSPTSWKGIVAYHAHGSYGRAQILNQSKIAKKDSRYYLKKWGVYPDKPYEAIPECMRERAAKGKYLSKGQLTFRNKIKQLKLKEAGEKLS